MPAPKQVLVTGGAGFLGTHLVRRLRSAQVAVRVLDDLSGGHGEGLPAETRADLLRGDVRDSHAVAEAMEGCDAVVHLADRPVGPRNDREAFDVNVLGTLTVAEAARDRKVDRFVLASSCAVYGASGAPPFVEGRPPAPVSLTGASKVGAEAIVRALAESGAFPGVVLRFFHVYGAGRGESAHPGVLALWGRQVAEGLPPTVHGSGETTRDFVHVDDAVEAIRLALERRVARWTVANVGTGSATSLRTAAEAVTQALGRLDLEPVSVDAPPGPSVSSFADLRFARSALGFSPRIPLAEGLARKDFHLPMPREPA